MVFIRSFILSAVLAASSVVATAINRDFDPSFCNTGPIQCCESTTEANSPEGNAILTLLGMVSEYAEGMLAINCSPIDTGSVDGPTCSQSSVCCENNSFGSIVSIGCAPVSM